MDTEKSVVWGVSGLAVITAVAWLHFKVLPYMAIVNSPFRLDYDNVITVGNYDFIAIDSLCAGWGAVSVAMLISIFAVMLAALLLFALLKWLSQYLKTNSDGYGHPKRVVSLAELSKTWRYDENSPESQQKRLDREKAALNIARTQFHKERAEFEQQKKETELKDPELDYSWVDLLYQMEPPDQKPDSTNKPENSTVVNRPSRPRQAKK